MIALADVGVAVSNAEEAALWWTEKLGFAVHRVGGGKHAIMVAPPNERFILHLCEGIEPVEPGNTGVAFMTDEIEGLVQKMEAGGVHFPSPLKKESWGSMAQFADPDGNVFWLLGADTAFIRNEVGRRASRESARRSAGPSRKRGSRRSSAPQ